MWWKEEGKGGDEGLGTNEGRKGEEKEVREK